MNQAQIQLIKQALASVERLMEEATRVQVRLETILNDNAQQISGKSEA